MSPFFHLCLIEMAFPAHGFLLLLLPLLLSLWSQQSWAEQCDGNYVSYAFALTCGDPSPTKIVEVANYTCKVADITSSKPNMVGFMGLRCAVYKNDSYWYAYSSRYGNFQGSCGICCITCDYCGDGEFNTSFFYDMKLYKGASSFIAPDVALTALLLASVGVYLFK